MPVRVGISRGLGQINKQTCIVAWKKKLFFSFQVGVFCVVQTVSLHFLQEDCLSFAGWVIYWLVEATMRCWLRNPGNALQHHHRVSSSSSLSDLDHDDITATNNSSSKLYKWWLIDFFQLVDDAATSWKLKEYEKCELFSEADRY